MSPDTSDPIEELFARRVTDGLPAVPPTAERVRAAVAASGRRGDELIGLVAPANGRATVERVAVNAVMAGCRPDYLPVVLAAVEAICDPDFALVGVSGTTDAVTPLVIVCSTASRSTALLAQRHPALRERIVFLTGDVLSREKRAFLEQTGAPFLTKPCDLDELRRLIARVIAPAPAS